MSLYNNVTLFSRSKTNKILEWKASTDYLLDSNGWITITINWGQQDGKFQNKIIQVKSGKNIGKANQTTIQQQADLKIGYLYQQQLDKGYVININDYVNPLRPVLAHKYKDRKHTVKWVSYKDIGCMDQLYYASKKLNGIRCFIFLEKGSVTKFESRTGKPFKYFNHIANDLKDHYLSEEPLEESKFILDGELFNKNIPFEILCSLINSDEYVEVKDEATQIVWSTKDVQFHCYDIIDLNHIEDNFYDRFVDCFSLPVTDNIYCVQSSIVESEDEMLQLASQWIKDGYEGLMLRFGGASYEFGIRSNNLLKYKIMEQEEFEILNIYLAENDDTKVMFKLKNHHNTDEKYSIFDCALKGDKALNMEYYNNRDNYIKKYLTVDYQTLSQYNVPLFPVGIIIREDILDGNI